VRLPQMRGFFRGRKIIMWVLLALGASVFWGLEYVFDEQIYKKISVSTSLAITSIIIFIITFFISYFAGNLKPDLEILAEPSSKRLLFYIFGGIITLLIAELCLGFSITAKNATLAGLIEISYPIFIALFSYLFFNEKISLATLLGGLIIFTGVFVIYFFN
jgi:drug/metabolite transporter (DMT)-like permease